MPLLPPIKIVDMEQRLKRLLQEWAQILRTTPQIKRGNGVPEAVVEAERGTFWLRNDGSPGSYLYFKSVDAILGDARLGWELINATPVFNALEAYDFRAENTAYSGPTWSTATLFDLKGAGNTIFSLSFWLYQSGTAPNTASPNTNEPYFSVGSLSAGAGSRSTAFCLQPRLAVGTSTAFGVNTVITAGNSYAFQLVTTPAVNQFHHWLIVMDGSQPAANRVSVYIDGAPVTVTPFGGANPDTNIGTSTKDFAVGAQSDVASYQAGAIKNFGVYTGVALGASDATDHYNAGDPVDLTTASNNANLSAYWRFTTFAGDSSASVIDQVAGTYPLSALVGSPTIGVV